MSTPFALALFGLSGALSALAFPPYGVSWILWVSLVPAMVAAARVRPRVAIGGGFLFGLLQALLLLRWFFGLFGPFALVTHALFALFFAIYFRLLQGLVARLGTAVLLGAAAPLWVAVEFFRCECWKLRFSWFALGYSQHDNLPLLQLASIGGVYGLSLLLSGSNGALSWVALATRPLRQRALAAVAVIGLMAGAHLLGGRMLGRAEAGVRVVGIEGEEDTISSFVDRSEEALGRFPDARLLVWPEYAVGPRLNQGSPLLRPIARLAQHKGIHVLLGATRDAPGPPPNNFDNTLLLIGPDGQLAGTQVKSVPVPFFIDGRPAAGRAPLPFGEAKIGAGICYDMDFTYISRELVQKGAHLLVFPTMDAQHWGALQHVQHATLAPFRAVEHRRFLLRVTTSGISLLVDPYGRVQERTGLGAPKVLAGEVGLRGELTFYTRWGFYLPHLCLAFAAALLLLAARRRVT